MYVCISYIYIYIHISHIEYTGWAKIRATVNIIYKLTATLILDHPVHTYMYRHIM